MASNPINPLLPGATAPLQTAAAPRRAEQAAAGKADEATISTAGAVFARPEAGGVDEAKVAEMRRLIAEGSYAPNPRAIAEKLLQEAWEMRQA